MDNLKNYFFGDKSRRKEERIKLLFDTLYPRLVFFAMEMLKEKAVAEDMVQDAFVQLWNHIDHIQDEGVIYKQYIYRSVKNNCLNYIRHQRVRDKYEEIQNLEGPLADANFLEKIIEAEVLGELSQAIESLPLHLKTISELSYFEGKKNQEIADELGISINTLKKQKQKSLQMLRMKLTSFFSFLLF